MRDSPPSWFWPFLGVVVSLLLAAELFNIWQINQLEWRLLEIKNGGVAAGGPAVAPVSRPTGEPGASTGITATGWGGKQAEILFVEGAVPDAPLTLDQKPRPQGDTYVSRRPSAPSSLNRYTTNEGEARTIARDVMDTLMRLPADKPDEPAPSLAVRWEVSEDKLTYTFHLRRGVLFADGRPFTSADVKFSFDVLRDPAVQAEILRSNFEDVVSVEAPDPYTVVFQYNKLDWSGLLTIGTELSVLNKGWVEEQIPVYAQELGIAEFSTQPGAPGFGEVFNKIRIPPPGTGPYMYPGRVWEKGQPLQLDKNPFYWGIQVFPEWYNFHHLRWVYIADEVAAFEAFRKGEFDVTVVDHDQWDDDLSKDESITSTAKYWQYDHVGLGYSYIAWNHRKPPFDDARVRLAMTHLVDRQFLLDELDRGRGRIAVGIGKPIYPEYHPTLKPWPFDPQRASELLAEAGWKDTNGDGVLDRNGARFEFEFKYPTGNSDFEQVAEILNDACRKVGIRITKRPLEWATFIEDLYERRFDSVSLIASYANPFIDPWSFHSSGDTPRGPNTSGWRNAEVDKILEEFKGEFDREKRIALFHRFHEIWHQEQPETLLVHSLVGVLQDDRFEDVRLFPAGLRNHEYWVKPENVRYK